MPKTCKDITGQRFNYFTVISKSNDRTNTGIVYWNCLCDCGKQFKCTSYVIRKVQISCGCKHIESIRKPDVAIKQKYSHYKRDAIKNKRLFELTFNEFKNIITSECYYCGSPPRPWSPYVNADGNTKKRVTKSMNREYIKYTFSSITGVDRIDSAGGYTTNNVVPCCRECNFMKNDYGLSFFLNHIIKIYNHISTKQNIH
jgi:hypothetical protein